MTAPQETEHQIPSLFDWMDDFAREVIDGMTTPPEPDAPISVKIGAMMDDACSREAPATFDSLFCYVAAARGLHAASQRVREKGDNPSWAKDLHDMGQLFLTYAVGDIEAMVTMAQATNAASEPASVH